MTSSRTTKSIYIAARIRVKGLTQGCLIGFGAVSNSADAAMALCPTVLKPSQFEDKPELLEIF
jgi:hypothetical protein